MRLRDIRERSLPLIIGALLLPAAPAPADQVVLEPSKDNTLFESLDGSLSNGIGQYLFTGRTLQGADDDLRRAVLAFDVAGNVPPGSTINSARFTLFMSRTIAGNTTVTLHRLRADWGEGASNASGQEGEGAPAEPGDATWLHTFWDTAFWATPGGDYQAAASAAMPVGGNGTYAWGSTPQMVADVQGWLDEPTANSGWIVIGDEDAQPTAKRFNSRESTSNRPALSIDFTPPPPCPADVTGDGVVNVFDLLAVLAAWGPCPGCPADINADGTVNVFDLLEVLAAWGPCP